MKGVVRDNNPSRLLCCCPCQHCILLQGCSQLSVSRGLQCRWCLDGGRGRCSLLGTTAADQYSPAQGDTKINSKSQIITIAEVLVRKTVQRFCADSAHLASIKFDQGRQLGRQFFSGQSPMCKYSLALYQSPAVPLAASAPAAHSCRDPPRPAVPSAQRMLQDAAALAVGTART